MVGRLVRNLAALVAVIVSLLIPAAHRTLVWGPVPIISNKYWSLAMREAGRDSVTLMENVYAINDQSDFDRYFDDLSPHWIPSAGLRHALAPAFALLWTIRNAQVVHMPFTGGPLGRTFWWRLEAPLMRIKGIKTAVMPYGSDAYVYSRVMDTSLRLALQNSYPDAARAEERIVARIDYWSSRADFMMTGSMLDGLGRSDLISPQPCVVDTSTWVSRETYSDHDGIGGPVYVMHTPNHRGFKGTEFLVQAVSELNDEGLKVELMLLEGVPNATVREAMQRADIFAEQFLFSMYALSGIEAMASGIPLLVNLDVEAYTRPFRRYSFLNECPALSSSPETLKANLRRLVVDPALRRSLGMAGRQYVEKYHSYAAAQYLWGAVHDVLLGVRDRDLRSLYRPASKDDPSRVQHPLVENKLPATTASIS